MGKIATQYIQEDAYRIIERGFHKERSKVSESLFSLGNEYHGIRGFFDEGGSVDSLQGSYFNGMYEYALEETPNAYLGIVKRTHFMINSVNWIKCKLTVEGETLDLGKSNFKDFERSLDFRDGVLVRSFTWIVHGNEIRICFRRMLGMTHCHRAFQTIEIIAEKDTALQLELALDSNVLHWGDHCYYDREKEIQIDENTFLLNVKTPTTMQKLTSVMKVSGLDQAEDVEILPKQITVKYNLSLKRGVCKSIRRYVVNLTDKTGTDNFANMEKKALEEVRASFDEGFENQWQENRTYWKNFFSEHDIEIEGDLKNQQGIRFCLFQLQQTYHGFDPSNNIGAKGLTGEAYSGHTFWDTETYCLSYYLLNNTEAAKNLLIYRYKTLDQALKRAEMLDCTGACYPIATLNGEESCNLWQHASLQFQPSTGVAYAIFHYYHLTGDDEFLERYGYEMLVQISKFLLSRGDYNADRSGFGFYCVMGPDEFQMMVNHNTYTNYMAKRTFEFTLEVRSRIGHNTRAALEEKCSVTDRFFEEIREAAEKMIILYDEKTKLFEQHEGYFHLPHIDIDSIPVEDFPLYHHWSYDRIYRNDMIKQPDVLMFLFLYNQSFTKEQKLNNYEYYEPRCIHESSLSPSVHSILACELHKMQQALDFFGFATRLDLDDYNRNTCEGLHTTSIAAAWSNIVYGFGGVRTDGPSLRIDPVIPASWKRYRFFLHYRDAMIEVEVTQEHATIRLLKGRPVEIVIHDKTVSLEKEYRLTYGN